MCHARLNNDKPYEESSWNVGKTMSVAQRDPRDIGGRDRPS